MLTDTFFHTFLIFFVDNVHHLFISCSCQFLVSIAKNFKHSVINRIKREALFQIATHDTARKRLGNQFHQSGTGLRGHFGDCLSAVAQWEKFLILLYLVRGGHMERKQLPAILFQTGNTGETGIHFNKVVAFLKLNMNPGKNTIALRTNRSFLVLGKLKVQGARHFLKFLF